MTTPRADPRALVAVTVTAALTGAGAGFFWTRMSGTFLVVFNVAEPPGGYRIPLLAAFSALLQFAVAWTARTVRPA